MCGPIIFTIGSSKPRLIAYHAGRFVSYTALGALAGSLGETAFSFSSNRFVSSVFLMVLAFALLFVGWKTYTGQSLHLQFLKGTLWKSATRLKLPPVVASAVTGLMSVFLPCGHLYTFALAAAATGSVWRGGALMFAFWLGTLPALGFGVHLLKHQLVKLGPNRYRIAAVIMVTTGLLSLGNFALELFSDKDPQVKAHSHSHHSH